MNHISVIMRFQCVLLVYGGSQFQNPEVFPSHKTMFSPFYIYAYDLENFFYFQHCDRPYFIRFLIGNQCNSQSSGVASERNALFITILARLFCIRCNFLALFSSSEKRRLCYRRVCLSVCKPIFSRTMRHTEPIFSASLRLYFPWKLSKFGSFLTTKFGITW